MNHAELGRFVDGSVGHWDGHTLIVTVNIADDAASFLLLLLLYALMGTQVHIINRHCLMIRIIN